MTMKRTPEWLAAYERRMAESRNKARDWNGNCEPVKLTSGGVESRHASGAARSARQSLIDNAGQPSTQAATSAGVAPGPLTLPWPPSGNTAVRHAKNAKTGASVHYLRPEVTAYRQAVAVLVGRSEPITGRYELHLEMSPPDAKRRDIDNALKSLLDALVHAGWLPDDSMAYMRKLVVTVDDGRRGDVTVRAVA